MLQSFRRRLSTTFSAGNWLPILARSGRDAIAITLDDGPSPGTTPAVLEVLRRFEAKATFFLCGSRVEQHPELAAQIAAEGHGVYAHGFDHVRMDELSPRAFLEDLSRTEALLSRIRPTPSPYLVRLPYGSGHRAVRVHKLLRDWRPDCRIVHWRYPMNDHALAEGCESEEELARRCAAAADKAFAEPRFVGSIVLMHEDPLGVEGPLAPRIAPLLLTQILQRAALENVRTVPVEAVPAPSPVSSYIRTVTIE
jgi:peptidoglycan/xylan/chitin deacetylase (PgdA/CDA1 family)